jgi:glyoxylase-like metal-dependent hydrolase (beta-lactamase superfamily II)
VELTSGIHLIPRVRGANAYVVRGEAGGDRTLTLIDAGIPGNATRIMEFLDSLDIPKANGCTIILTHPDIDHSGSVAELKKRLGNVKVAIHEADAPRLAGEEPLKEVRGTIGLVFGVMSPLMRFVPVKADILLKDGERMNGLRVIHTPGHTRGSISLYSESLNAIFVGDALRTDRNGNLKPPSAMMTLNVHEARDSIKKIGSYEFELLLPGHGSPVLRDGSKKVKELVAGLR